MCLAPKTPTIQPQAVTPPPAPAPIAPESPVDSGDATRQAATARRRLRIDLASPAPAGGSGLNIPQ